jgi:nickel transport protein
VYAYVEGDRIVVEGYFSGKARAANCAVSVIDVNGNRIAEGRTDDKGVCVLRLTDTASAQRDLKVVLDAGHGHRAEYTIAATDRVAAAGGSSNPETHGTAVRRALSEQASSGNLDAASQVSPEQVAMLVNQALEEKMKPILQMLAQQQRLLMEQSQRGPGLREIIGGIGWIFGLVGVAAYFMSRRRSG